MIIKYRVHEVAKDFDKTSKEILSFIDGFREGEKKAQTALEQDELDLIFDKITKKNSLKTLDEYFSQGKTAEKPEIKKEEKKPATDKKPKVKTEQTKEKAPTKAKEPKKEENLHPFKKKQEDEEKVFKAKTKGEVHRIDTRTGSVNLDKYNEKYQNLADSSTNASRRADGGFGKQKIKSKKRFKHQGMRAKRHETEAERLKRIKLEREKKGPMHIEIPETISVSDLAAMLKLPATAVIKKLMSFGVMATTNEEIDYETAAIAASELGAIPEKKVVVTIEEKIIDDSVDDEKDLIKRNPVVVVMGHVDHGKTSLLDTIRKTSVTDVEAGGITQHIGAYKVKTKGGEITFLDTPGHAAFTSMRARGAKATDIAIIVVAADDGIMPQTVEAINHAKAAQVEIIVAINKIDKPGANPDKILQQLTEYELIPEEWGGDIICVPVSAKQNKNIDKLLEAVNLVAEMKELKANPNRAASGTVIEAQLDKGKGPVATLLVQNGTLRQGDTLIAGIAVGRVRVMLNDKRQSINTAGPSTPVEIMGLDEVPEPGDLFNAVSDEKLARQLADQRKAERKQEEANLTKKVTLDNLFSSIEQGEMKELKIIVKADVQGSVEAVTQNLSKISNDEVKVNVIHGGVGAINDTDVMLASTSDAIIVGFNVRPIADAKERASREGVDIRTYRVIYECIEEIEAAMKGMLEPTYSEVVIGNIEVREVFKISGVGTIAGCYVTSGKITSKSKVRVIRDGVVIAEDDIASLKRFKDDVKEVATNFECGIGLEKYNDIKVGDEFEAFIMQENKI
ncbi:MAG: translation initiation factor IF-2 [Clostridia bacterium]|nr:translation initiation factor IF-2 [Clostridia bacterium]